MTGQTKMGPHRAMCPQLKRVIIFNIICQIVGAFEKVKVYSFGATRTRHNHLLTKSDEYIDWNDLHCVRLDHEPIEVPNQYTWCAWYMMDMLPPDEGTVGCPKISKGLGRN